MDILKKSLPLSLQLKRYFWLLLCGWTVAVAASLLWNITEVRAKLVEAARIQATLSFEKDVITRRWAAHHGGVYVPVEEDTPPNPYLAHLPERDITTASGRALTLMNPAYITRQIHEMEEKELSFRGHITSLKPINPKNAPDPWESTALKAFQEGKQEVVSLEEMHGKTYMRLIRPFVTDESCLKCHASQGDKVGDIRGGISVSIPMAPIFALMRTRIWSLSLAHLFLYLVGLSGIVLGAQQVLKSELERERAEEALQNLSITDELTGILNRRGFFTFAKQQLKIAVRAKTEMTLLYADLDKLKWINDTMGHAEGDRALHKTAAILKQTFRESDILARIGGDEFVVLAVNTEGANATILVAHLQDALQAFNRTGALPYALSLSLGTALFTPDAPVTPEQLLTQADSAMYTVKKDKRA
jgi:diguanylate cyclase (GGDEF)-like protein